MCATKEAQQILQGYLDSSGKSVSFLASNSSVGRSTIDRILKGSVKTTPTAETCRRLGYFVSKKSNIKEMADHFNSYPKFRETLLEGIPYSELHQNQTYVTDLEWLLESWENFVVFTLSSHTDEGASKSDFKEICGNFCDSAINTLLDKKVITQKGDRYINTIKNFHVPKQVIYRHLPKLVHVNTMDSKLLDWKINYWVCSGFTEEAAYKAAQIMNKAIMEVRAMKLDEENHGEVPFNMVVSVNSFDIAGEL